MARLESPDFQRAFAALSYVCGRRDAELLDPIRPEHDLARGFVRRLAHPERAERAEVLSRELTRLASALAARIIK